MISYISLYYLFFVNFTISYIVLSILYIVLSTLYINYKEKDNILTE